MEDSEKEQRIKNIDFMVGACQYRLKRIREEIQYLCSRWKEPKGSERERLIQNLKSRKARFLEFGIPITIIPERGYGKLIYEFNAFVTELITCVNYATDLKARLLDGYKKPWALSIANYYYNSKNIVKDEGELHQFLSKSFEEWIKPVNDIRNEIIHKATQHEVYVQFIVKIEVLPTSKLKYHMDAKIKIPYEQAENLDMLSFCETGLEKLTGFTEYFIKKLG